MTGAPKLLVAALLACASLQACVPAARDTAALQCAEGQPQLCRCDGGLAGVALCTADGILSACDCDLAIAGGACGDSCVVRRPSCQITAPVATPTRPVLSGEHVSVGGDRVGSSLDPMAFAATVQTDGPDGTTVTLGLDGGAARLTARAIAGVAVFAAIEVPGDGTHTLTATCETVALASRRAEPVSVTVDATRPAFSVTSPSAGSHTPPSADADPGTPGLQLNVCVETAATDIGSRARDGSTDTLCAAVGGASPRCAPAAGGCVRLDCPGGAPFSVQVSLEDFAGNISRQTIDGVSCAAQTPSVQIVSPTATAAGDQSTRLLAADAPQPLRDLDATAPRAQWDVRACTNAPRATAWLHLRREGDTTPLWSVGPATVVPAEPGDGCPAGHAHVARFDRAALPESLQTPDGALDRATALDVEVIDESRERGVSPTVTVWVDSEAPTVVPSDYSPLCGLGFQTPLTTSLAMMVSVADPTLTVTNTLGTIAYPAGPDSYFPFASFDDVVFTDGENTLVVDAVEPSGNRAGLPNPCVVTVSNKPVVSWLFPGPGAQLSVANQTPPSDAPGWQGELRVSVDLTSPGTTVEFFQGDTSLGVAPCVVDSGACEAALAVSLADTSATTLRAVATDGDTSPAGRGVGSRQRGPLLIDTIVPGTPGALSTMVVARRQTAIQLRWTSPDDGGAAPLGYDVRVAETPITTGPEFDAARRVPFTAAIAAVGQEQQLTVSNLFIERDYHFATVAYDAAGNRSAMSSTGTATRAAFNRTVIEAPPPAEQWLGYLHNDGSCDFNGDGYSDLLLGTFAGARAYLYLGSATGPATQPAVVFSGNSGTFFGSVAVCAGDLDADGRNDIAIGASGDAGDGRVYIFKGRANWPAALDASLADTTIEVDRVADPRFSLASFGYELTRLADFDGDGFGDLAIATLFFDGYAGQVTVLRGGPSLPAQIRFPQDYGTHGIALAADNPTQGAFGAPLLGLAPFYGSRGDLIVGSSESVGSAGRIDTFAGRQGTATYQQSEAHESRVGPMPIANTNNWFAVTLAPLGALLGGYSFAYPEAASSTRHAVTVQFSGGGSLFQRQTRIVSQNEAANYDWFGSVLTGGGLSGRADTVSFIGGDEPDLVVTSWQESGAAPKLYLFSGAKLATAAGTTLTITTSPVGSSEDVRVALPDGFRGALSAFTIADIDGDGYGDLGVSEGRGYFSSEAIDGRVVIYW